MTGAVSQLSTIYFGIQKMLIPALLEECGLLSAKEKRFIAICELLQLESFMEPFVWRGNGRKPLPRLHMARAFIAKALWNLPTTRSVIDRLVADPSLRRLCGWENGPSQVPDEATFSRAFADFTHTGLNEAVHKHLVEHYLGEETIWYCSTDGTAIHAREKPHREPVAGPCEPILAPLQAAPAPTPGALAAAEKSAPFKRKRGRPKKGQVPPSRSRRGSNATSWAASRRTSAICPKSSAGTAAKRTPKATRSTGSATNCT